MRLRQRVGRFLLAYVPASLVASVVLYEGGAGHADVPFTTFPEYLLVAPLVPVPLVVGMIWVREAEYFIAAAVLAVVFASVWIAAGALSRRIGARGERHLDDEGAIRRSGTKRS